MTKSYAGAYWGPRADGRERSAARIVELVRRLADYDPLLAGWRDKGGTKAQALANPVVNFDEQQMVERLSAARNRSDVNGEIIENLGFSAYWWNGSTDRRTTATLSIGVDSVAPGVSNRVVLHLPDSAFAPHLYRPDVALGIITALIEIFSPDQARWTDSELCKPQTEADEPLEGGGYKLGQLVGVPAGWANFLRDGVEPRFDEAMLPPCTQQSIGGGTLVVVGDDPAAPSLDAVLAVRRAMGYPVPGAESRQAGVGGTPVTATTLSTHGLGLQKTTGAPDRAAPEEPAAAKALPVHEVADASRDELGRSG